MTTAERLFALSRLIGFVTGGTRIVLLHLPVGIAITKRLKVVCISSSSDFVRRRLELLEQLLSLDVSGLLIGF